MAGRGTRATAALQRAGVVHRVHELPVGAADGPADGVGLAAARAMGVDPGRVYKTLVAEADGRLVVGIVPVAGSLDMKALAASVGAKRAVMADAAAAERATGYVRGGISPLGQRTPIPTVLDASAGAHPTVFVSGGRRGLELELAPGDLARLIGATVAPIASVRER